MFLKYTDFLELIKSVFVYLNLSIILVVVQNKNVLSFDRML